MMSGMPIIEAMQTTNNNETPMALLSYIATRDKRSALFDGDRPISDAWNRLINGQIVLFGGRATCGAGAADRSWVAFCAWNEVVRKAQKMGVNISVTKRKVDNGWATKARGFWHENEYQILKEQA